MRRTPTILLAFLVPTALTSAGELTRGPYLQLLTTHSVTVVWKTRSRAACSLALRRVGGASSVVQGGTGTACAIVVEGLQPGTEYGYIPRADGTALDAESVFRTDDPSRPYTFLVVGDSGGGGKHQLGVRDRMLASPADFILHTGDMIYETGEAEDYDPKFFTLTRSSSAASSSGPVWANTTPSPPEAHPGATPSTPLPTTRPAPSTTTPSTSATRTSPCSTATPARTPAARSTRSSTGTSA